jgi:PST family polysaccharide transporter
VCNVYLLKGILFLISLGILTVLIKILPQARGQEKLFYLSMWVGLYEFIVPFWYFQGMEKMKYITVINLISRSIFAFLIFRLINSPDDYLLVPVINGIGAVIAGFFGIFIIFSRDKLSFVIDDLTGLYRLFKEALNYFISDLSIKLFAGSNKVIVGSFLGYSELAYYDLVDKIIHVFRVLPLNIVRDSIYPIVVKTKNIQIIHNTSKAMSVYSLLVILFILFFAPYIVIGLGGEDMVAAIPILKFGSIIILTTHASNYYITAGLWSFGYSKLFRDMMIYSSLFYLIIYFIIWFLEVINLYTIIAAPILVDFFNLIYIYAIYKKYHFGP